MTFILLDNTKDKSEGAWLFENPLEIICADEAGQVADALAAIEKANEKGLFAAGFCSFELAYVLEPRLNGLLPTDRKVPLLWFGLFQHRQKLSPQQATDFLKNKAIGAADISALRPSWNSDDYTARFDVLRNYIKSGDVYQINLTFKTEFESMGDPVALYLKLREQQAVAYGAYIDAPEFKILSLSPELFIRQNGRSIETRPMKGTAARAYLPEEDARVIAALSHDTKSQAENLMIVDLMRNDIGRIAEIGSVQVRDLYAVETYKTLHQMISTVRAKLKKNICLVEMLKATFAPGSVVGAPKIHAMEIIRELENTPRGIYTGAIGMLCPNQERVMNVAIRTAILFPDAHNIYKGEMGVGSGVVYDSVAMKEYEECLLKTKFFTASQQPFGLIETLRYDKDGSYYLLNRHLERLKASADYFSIPYDEMPIKSALFEHVSGCQHTHLRVKLTLSHQGIITIESKELPAQALQQVVRYIIAPQIMQSANIHLYHKTTQRNFLDAPCKLAKDAHGCDEVLYLNERGELTQGSYMNLFLEQADGLFYTPPISAGLLPGTFRAEFMTTHRVMEKTLFPDDLATAKQVYLGNSVRGLLKANLIS